MNLYRFLQGNGWSKRLEQVDCFDENHVLYNDIFILQRYTNDYGVHKCLCGGVQVSGKVKIVAQDPTHLYLHDT